MRDFEFDKIALAIAFGIFAVIFSWNVGNMLYIPEKELKKPGYIIAIKEGGVDGLQQANINELPEEVDIVKIMADSDSKLGENVFKKCAICHTDVKDAKNKIGPNLWGIVNAKVAHRQDFDYSPAMQQRGQSGASWTYEDLYRYLYSPKKYVSGTKMAFAGIKDDKERAGLIMFLRQFSDNPEPLPQK